MDYIEKQIRDLEVEAVRLAEKRQTLQDKQKLYEALDTKLEKFFSESNFSSPKELAEALIEKYGIRISGRKPGSTRRRRTTITAELRDKVKSYVNSGQSMNAVSKQMEISYAVVVKIMKGSYDHLIARPGDSAKAA